MKNRYLPGLLVVASLVGLLTAGPATAQDDAMRTGNGPANAAEQRRDNDPNWGWLGLAGLAGLAGLRRPEPAAARHNQEPNRAH